MTAGIEGKVVVITGASSGLGEAAAQLLSAQGAVVVLGARRIDRLRSLADQLTSTGAKALALQTDVTHFDQVKKLVDAASLAFGRIDVMINNAGLMPNSPLDRLKIDDWNQMIDVNIKGVLYGIAAALPYMKRQKAGHMINVSSVAGHIARRMRMHAAYKPVAEDWLFYLLLLAASACAVRFNARGALFAVAAAALLLLFAGIHNARDAVTYHVYSSPPARQQDQR